MYSRYYTLYVQSQSFLVHEWWAQVCIVDTCETNTSYDIYTHMYSAALPDVLERILPADGQKQVGHLFVEVLQEIGKLQNFAVYLEGSRVPLELDVDTSVLVGQKVYLKYLPGPCKSTSLWNLNIELLDETVYW